MILLHRCMPCKWSWFVGSSLYFYEIIYCFEIIFIIKETVRWMRRTQANSWHYRSHIHMIKKFWQSQLQRKCRTIMCTQQWVVITASKQTTWCHAVNICTCIIILQAHLENLDGFQIWTESMYLLTLFTEIEMTQEWSLTDLNSEFSFS